MDVYNYLNKKLILKNMSDEKFEKFLPNFTQKLVDIGFDKILFNYNKNLKYEKDWLNLKNKKINKNYINSTNTTGMKIIKIYMPHIYEVQNYKGKSIKNMWNYKNLEKAIRTNRKSHSTPYISEIIRQVGFCAGTSKVTVYRPLLAKIIIEYFKNIKNLKRMEVLDPCVGWGGRVLGAKSIDNVTYTGIEPCTKTYKGLFKIKQLLNLKNVILYHNKAENILPDLKNNHYDLALTSPPYYNLEIYSEEKTQSHHYGNYENWVNLFLKPVVNGVLNKLKDTGISCWSVKNFKTDKKYNLYDKIVELHKLKNWILMDKEFYVGNCIRPGLNKKGKEITYCFCKQT